MLDREKASGIVAEYKQEHIMKYFDELNEEEKEGLLKQIEITDFSVLSNLDGNKENIARC